jgi:hypothetical protein
MRLKRGERCVINAAKGLQFYILPDGYKFNEVLVATPGPHNKPEYYHFKRCASGGGYWEPLDAFLSSP